MDLKGLKIALVHDFLVQFGGAERVLLALSEMFPQAPIYTILYDQKILGERFRGRDIRTSFFQKLPRFLRKRFKYFLFLLPVAPETYNLREFDLVISSSGAWSKGIVTRLDTVHIAYIHSPMRFVWDRNEKYLREEGKAGWGFFLWPLFGYFRLWDRLAADRPDHLIANSRYTRERIRKYYRRESEVIYPPINIKSEIQNLKFETNSKFFLIVSRLSAYKKIDVAIEAFNKLGLPLVVVGRGKEEKSLRKIAGPKVKFLGFQPEEKLAEIYAGARALVFPVEDDFGLAAAEAQSFGIPVIALKKGGALEIVEEGKTGIFFESPTVEVLADGVRRFMENEKNYDREYIKKSAEKFSQERFIGELSEFVKQVVKNEKIKNQK